MAEGDRRRLKLVDNLDVNGISKDLFVQFVGNRCLVDKARDNIDLVSSTLHNSIKNNIAWILDCSLTDRFCLFVRIREALLIVQFTFSTTSIPCSPCTATKWAASSSDTCSRFFPHGPHLTTSCFIQLVSPIGA